MDIRNQLVSSEVDSTAPGESRGVGRSLVNEKERSVDC